MPITLTAALFTATIVGATTVFVRLGHHGLIDWFMYLFLVFYRVKVFLDDLTYYGNYKDVAIRRGDPAIAFTAWVLWLAMAAVIGSPIPYFSLTAATFGVMAIWILVARKNISGVTASGPDTPHLRWLLVNLILVVASLVCVNASFQPDGAWQRPVLVCGPAVMLLVLVLDAATGYEHMFPKAPNT